MPVVNKIILYVMLVLGFACAKSAQEYFTDASYLYTDARLPSAAIEARTGLAQYPSDVKLQRLLKRIEEAQKEQEKQNNKDNPSKNDQKQDQDQKSSSSGQGQGQSQNASSQAQSSSSGKGDSKPDEQNASSQSGASSASEEPLKEGQLSKDQAEQMLKDFQENDKERKRTQQMHGRAAPEKDW